VTALVRWLMTARRLRDPLTGHVAEGIQVHAASSIEVTAQPVPITP